MSETQDGARVCLHCGVHPINRPRGLCWGCYHTPGVRQLYPKGAANPDTAKYVGADEPTREEVEAMVREQLPTMPLEPGDPKPLRTAPRGRGDLDRGRVERTWREWDAPPAWSLSGDTSPEAIAESQREAVAGAVRELGPGATAERVSEAVCLPVWVVERRMRELLTEGV